MDVHGRTTVFCVDWKRDSEKKRSQQYDAESNGATQEFTENCERIRNSSHAPNRKSTLAKSIFLKRPNVLFWSQQRVLVYPECIATSTYVRYSRARPSRDKWASIWSLFGLQAGGEVCLRETGAKSAQRSRVQVDFNGRRTFLLWRRCTHSPNRCKK